MHAKKRHTHPRQLAALARKSSPSSKQTDGDGTYGWLGEVPEKVRRRRNFSGVAPSSGRAPDSLAPGSMPPDSMPPDSMPPPTDPPESAPRARRHTGSQSRPSGFEPAPALSSETPFDRRPTMKLKAIPIGEINFDNERVLELDAPATPKAADPAIDDPGFDIAGCIEDALGSSPPPRRTTPIRVSLPLFAAVHYDTAGDDEGDGTGDDEGGGEPS